MHRVMGVGAGCLITLLLTVGGGWLGLELGLAWNRGAFAQWQRLPDPPAPAQQIVSGSTEAIIIQATDGNQYRCNTSGEPCWMPATGSETLQAVGEDCADYPVDYPLRTPPQQPVDTLETYWCHIEAGEEVDYAIMADGSVWAVRQFDANFLGLARAFGPMLAGAAIGLVGGIALTGVGFWRRKSLTARTGKDR